MLLNVATAPEEGDKITLSLEHNFSEHPNNGHKISEQSVFRHNTLYGNKMRKYIFK